MKNLKEDIIAYRLKRAKETFLPYFEPVKKLIDIIETLITHD